MNLKGAELEQWSENVWESASVHHQQVDANQTLYFGRLIAASFPGIKFNAVYHDNFKCFMIADG